MVRNISDMYTYATYIIQMYIEIMYMSVTFSLTLLYIVCLIPINALSFELFEQSNNAVV